MLNRIFVVDSVTLTSTGSSVVRVVPFDKTINKLPTQVVVKATGQGAYVRLSADGSAATSADVYVQAGDHVVMSVQGRSYVAALSDGASSTVSVGSLSTGISGAYTFTPLELFGSAQGAWYDPSDSTTLFSDTAGTTPCPTPGSTGNIVNVGLMLDKSKGLALGSELVTNGDFSSGTTTGWNVLSEGPVTPTLSIVGGALQTTYTTVSGAGRAGAYQAITTVAGTWYKVSGIARHVAGTDRQASVRIGTGSGNDYANYTIIAIATTVAGSTFTAFTAYFFATAASTTILLVSAGTGLASTFTDQFDNLSVQSLAGNHAIRYGGTTTAPELSARVNLLTYSEQFDNPAWTKTGFLAFGSGSVANTTATLDPAGGNTADLLVEDSATSSHQANSSTVSGTSSTTYTLSRYVKAGTGSRWITLVLSEAVSGHVAFAHFQPSTNTIGVFGTSGAQWTSVAFTRTDAGNGWYRLVLTATLTNAATLTDQSRFKAVDNGPSSYAGDGTSSMYWWGADLRPSNIGTSVPAYQRIADQYTYDSNGFPRYLRFDGVDDGMSTPANLNLSGTDKATVFAGVRKLSDAAAGFVAELSDNRNNNAGSWAMTAPATTAANYVVIFRGSLNPVNVTPATTFTAPISNVLTGVGNIAADTNQLRVNGSAFTTSTDDLGTGNFGTYPLYIGSRGNASGWFNGYLYSAIVVGTSLSAAQISSTESWIAGKEGITL